MKTVYLSHPLSIDALQLKPTVMALGFFDGIHLGHQKVINTAINIAKENEMQSAVLTLDPHPSVVLRNDMKNIRYITPLKEKEEILQTLGVDILYVVSFTPELAKLSPQSFVDQYIKGLNVKHIVAGFDYSFGSFGKGTMETMPQFSNGAFTQTVIEKLTKDNQKVSSSLIRENLQLGKVDKVKEILGRFYSLKGTVVDGDKRGRTIGFPTANIELTDEYIIPKPGVYAVTMEINDVMYNGVCNVGVKPTFTDNTKVSIEVHLFDFNENIYGEQVRVNWHFYIRSEQKFPSFKELVQQIEADKQFAINYFQKNNALT
ncbi:MULTISPECIES: bifunctional riboflavin kinase/FAD synthetase [Sutcliffiella]|uniref:Riboflavin biosynthesis protein n=1 Tax=Sutcliffiella cohnii TaxID=33932 RepID=A0A223KR98_9BACI|nr:MULTISPECIES: bifunctional riboflavin kinase/FAD synthetase [Sutcliffiella]AST92015.1 riboflavin biosynthesis protein RibF [Sutcliffiella cohnii]MED4015296.1 bifunctional riboflavin kinase/FAD synthetase [Sutcliffiella cohnii]WBL13250.1 bifunctional riboflavin kinase/FAD synthetase [Sutcliffiella sp. NC1]